MSVEFQREDFKRVCRKYHQVRDVIQGDIRLKDHDYNAQSIFTSSNQLGNTFWNDNYLGNKQDSYLRRVNPSDNSPDNNTRNAQYIKCAVFMNATKHTAAGMTGMMFRRDPDINFGKNLEYLIDDVDGSGMQLTQQVKDVGRNIVEVGRHGLFVDFPSTNGSTSVNDVNNGQRAYIDEYNAEQIINWRVEKFGAITKLVLVVLMETETVAIDGDDFTTEQQTFYRVLKLVDGLYVQEIHRPAQDDTMTIEPFEPKMGNGQRMDFIPFQFIGSENNSPEINGVTMYDISVVNIGHYRNSADVEENSFFASQMTLTATGMTQQWMTDIWKGDAQIGSRAVLTGPEGASFGSIQANESNLARSLMEDKEKQMIQLGAKLIEPNMGDKTATQAEIDSADNSSILSTIAANEQDAYNNAISWVQLFMNDSQKFVFELNNKFGIAQLNAQEITALMAALQSGGISKESFLWNMKQGHRIPEDISIEDELGRIVNNVTLIE